MDGLNAERSPDIDDIIDINARREIEFVDGARFDRVDRPANRRPRADGISLPYPISAPVLHDVGHRTLVSQHGGPEIGIAILQPPIQSSFRIGLGEYAVLIHLLREYIGDARHHRTGIRAFRRIGITGIEVGDAAQSESECNAHQIFVRLFNQIERHAHVGKSEAILVVAGPRLGLGGRGPREAHHRRDRHFVVPVHAQPCRIERHCRQVGAQRNERTAHAHRPGRTEILRTGDRREIPRHHQVAIECRTAEPITGGSHRLGLHAKGHRDQEDDAISFQPTVYHIPSVLFAVCFCFCVCAGSPTLRPYRLLPTARSPEDQRPRL